MRRVYALTLCSLLLMGCTQHQISSQNHSGYLSNYQRLTAFDDQRNKRWVSGKLQQYDKILLAPVQVFPNHPKQTPAQIKTAEMIAEYLDRGFKNILQRNNRLATEAGAKVLLFKPAITGISSDAKELLPHQYVLPVAIGRTLIQTATDRRPKVVEVFLEAQLVNSQSQQLEAEVISKGIDKQSDGDQITQDDVKALLDDWLENFEIGLSKLFASA